MNRKYTIRALKIDDTTWRAKYTHPDGSVVNGIVMLPEAQYPYFDILFKTEDEANDATYKYLIGKDVKPEDVEIKKNN